MFQFLQRQREPVKYAPDPELLSLQQLTEDANFPISIKAVAGLPPHPQRRFLRVLLPPSLLGRFNIRPISWQGENGSEQVTVKADADMGRLYVAVRHEEEAPDPLLALELQDNRFNGIDLNLVVVNDPSAERFSTDRDEAGRPTLFGTVHRNLAEEEQAMEAGLAPGQVRAGLKASGEIFLHMEGFLTMIAHYAIFLEPLTYASAWVFERRGFAYVRGHKLMDEIHREFQPGGKLHAALDGSTHFRRPEQWRSVRGRAWAIHDGILEEIDAHWDNLRMIKRVGLHAEVNTFPGAVY